MTIITAYKRTTKDIKWKKVIPAVVAILALLAALTYITSKDGVSKTAKSGHLSATSKGDIIPMNKWCESYSTAIHPYVKSKRVAVLGMSDLSRELLESNAQGLDYIQGIVDVSNRLDPQSSLLLGANEFTRMKQSSVALVNAVNADPVNTASINGSYHVFDTAVSGIQSKCSIH